MTVAILCVLFALTAAVSITGEYRGPRTIVYVFKPLTTILIIATALLADRAGPTERWLITIGLVFSLAGDIFLMLPEEPPRFFIPGLIVFLIAHVFYIVAFSLGVPWMVSDAWIALPFVAFGIGCAVYFWPHLGPMKGPVVAYILVILVMGWRSAVRIGVEGIPMTGAVLACVGAILFILSDLILAVNKFVRPFRVARLTNLTAYWGGQALIALSLSY